MTKNVPSKFVFLPIILTFLLSCELPILSTASSNPESIPIEIIIADTAAAAQTQTAVFFPPPTETTTLLPPPTSTNTETPTITSTATFIIVLPTITESFEPHSAGTGCELIAQTPVNNQVFSPSTNFDAQWTFKNTGVETWIEENADYKYVTGSDIHQKDIYDLPNSVDIGGEVTLTVSMKSPATTGTFSTSWELVMSNRTLCETTLTIVVE